MNSKMTRLGSRAAAGALIAAGPFVAACSSGPSYDEWAATDGAAGRINLDDVQKAFEDSESATDFEKRVNEIYEGDGLVLIRARQDPDALVLEGWEDLNRNYEIDDAEDDKLFDIVKRNDQHEMRGYGANSYYHHGFGAGVTYMLISAISPRGYYYTTPPVYARGGLSSHRDNYRGSSGYRSQVSRNSRYFTSQSTGFSSSRYNSAGQNLSTARTSYRSSQQSSGAYKSSSTGVRSSWGSTSRSSSVRSSAGRSGGGFRGFGGAPDPHQPRQVGGMTRTPSVSRWMWARSRLCYCLNLSGHAAV